uniref:Uncharacterized protein n=1 Tax=Percolomonas cosmopolitus TaxID=63605 RepID=A0A7S1KQD0_9EUKA|mmetsp:Transcript_4366/g.16450  ORF Transcript_4366/g.16450 Transcript_4366/m.16450 type:complete len:612 (+) Transcript_4366:37-1872(+)
MSHCIDSAPACSQQKRTRHTSTSFFSVSHLQILIFQYISEYQDLLSYAQAIYFDLFACSEEDIPTHSVIPSDLYMSLLKRLYYSQYEARLGCLDPNASFLEWHAELQRLQGLKSRISQFHLRQCFKINAPLTDFILKRNFVVIFFENKVFRYCFKTEEGCGDVLEGVSQRDYWHVKGFTQSRAPSFEYSDTSHRSASLCNCSNYALGAKRAMSNHLLLIRWMFPGPRNDRYYLTVLTPELQFVHKMQFPLECHAFAFVSEKSFVVHAGGNVVQLWRYEKVDQGHVGDDARESSPPKHTLIKACEWSGPSKTSSLAVPLRYSNAFLEGQYEMRDDASLESPILLSLHQQRIQFWKLPKASDQQQSVTPCGYIDISHKVPPYLLLDQETMPIISFTERFLTIINIASTDEEIDVYGLNFERAAHTKIHTISLGRHRFKHINFPMIKTRIPLPNPHCPQEEPVDYLLYEDSSNAINTMNLDILTVENSFRISTLKTNPFILSSLCFEIAIRGNLSRNVAQSVVWSIDLQKKSFEECVGHIMRCMHALDLVDDILVVSYLGVLYVLQFAWPHENGDNEIFTRMDPEFHGWCDCDERKLVDEDFEYEGGESSEEDD